MLAQATLGLAAATTVSRTCTTQAVWDQKGSADAMAYMSPGMAFSDNNMRASQDSSIF